MQPGQPMTNLAAPQAIVSQAQVQTVQPGVVPKPANQQQPETQITTAMQPGQPMMQNGQMVMQPGQPMMMMPNGQIMMMPNGQPMMMPPNQQQPETQITTAMQPGQPMMQNGQMMMQPGQPMMMVPNGQMAMQPSQQMMMQSLRSPQNEEAGIVPPSECCRLDFLRNPKSASYWLRKVVVEAVGLVLGSISISNAYKRKMSYEYANTARDFFIVAAVLDAVSWPPCLLYAFKVWEPPEGISKFTFALTTSELLSDIMQLFTSFALLTGEIYDQNNADVTTVSLLWLSHTMLWFSLVFAFAPQYAALTTPRCHARKCAKREKNFSKSCIKNPCYKLINIFCCGCATILWASLIGVSGSLMRSEVEDRCERLACLPTDFAGCDVTKFEPNNNNIDYGERNDWGPYIYHKEKHPGKFCSKDATESSGMCGYMWGCVGNEKWPCLTPGSVYGDDHDDAVSGLYRDEFDDDECAGIGPDGGCSMNRAHAKDYFATMPCAGATCWYGFEDKLDCEKFYDMPAEELYFIDMFVALTAVACAVCLCAHMWECRKTCLKSFDEYKKDLFDVHRGSKPKSDDMSHDNKHNNNRYCGCCPFCRYEDGDTGCFVLACGCFRCFFCCCWKSYCSSEANDKENAVEDLNEGSVEIRGPESVAAQITIPVNAVEDLNEGSVEIRGLESVAAQITIPVTVPPGASPGQQLIFTAPDGRQVSSIVPPNATAGSHFDVSIPEDV